MSTATNIACIGEPISWPRLERYALARSTGSADAAVREHITACPACAACLDEITSDVVALPPLHVPERAAAKPRWWKLAVPAGLAVAAAAILLLVLRPRGNDERAVVDELGEGRTRVKGLGLVEVRLVRERAGVVLDNVHEFLPGDRWKVLVTCAEQGSTWLDVGVVEQAALQADWPLAPAEVTCGNNTVVPGAFSLSGGVPHDVCVRLSRIGAPPRSLPRAGEPNVACVTLHPEPTR